MSNQTKRRRRKSRRHQKPTPINHIHLPVSYTRDQEPVPCRRDHSPRRTEIKPQQRTLMGSRRVDPLLVAAILIVLIGGITLILFSH